MSIHHLIEAVRQVEAAEVATIDPKERKLLERIGNSIRIILRGHGVFIGDTNAGCDRCGVNDRMPGRRLCKQCSESK